MGTAQADEGEHGLVVWEDMDQSIGTATLESSMSTTDDRVYLSGDQTSLVKAVGMNSPEMKAAKEEINELKAERAEIEAQLEAERQKDEPNPAEIELLNSELIFD